MDKLLDSIPYAALANAKKVHFLAGGLLIGALVFGGYWFTLHADSEIQYEAHVKKKGELDNTFLQYQQVIASKPMVERNVATLEAELVERKRVLPVESELPKLLHKVTDMGTLLGVQIASFKIGNDISKAEFYREVPLEVQINGGFYNTLGFFDWLQNLLQVVDIRDLKMENKKVKRLIYDPAKGTDVLKSVETVQTKMNAMIYAFVEDGS